MAEPTPPPKTDGRPRSSGSGSRQKEREGGVPVQTGGAQPGVNDLVRREPGGQGEHQTSDQVVKHPSSSKGKSSKKISLRDYNQTRNPVERILKLNEKDSNESQPAGYSPPRKHRHASPSPSPPGYRAEVGLDQQSVENQFGFTDFGGDYASQWTKPATVSSQDLPNGRADHHQQSAQALLNQQQTSSNQGLIRPKAQIPSTAQPYPGQLQQTAQLLLQQQLASSQQGQTLQSSQPALSAQLQQSARNMLNQQQFEAISNLGLGQFKPSQQMQQQQPANNGLNQQQQQPMNNGLNQQSFDPQADQGTQHRQGFPANGSVPGTQATQPDMMAGMPRSDLLTLLMLDMNSKYSDIYKQQAELFSSFKQQPHNDGSKSKQDDQKSESSEDESDDDMRTTWSGDPPSSRQGAIQVSESGLDFWSELIAVDENGKKELRFKKLPKYPNKLKMYTEGEDLAKFRPPALNQELMVNEGWRAKQEEDRISLQKFAGAAGSALCLSVDNLRGVMDDLYITAQDFRAGKFQNPSEEAERILSMMISLLEEGVVSHVVDALKFVAANFGAINLRRHSATLSQGYLSQEAKRVLEQSPPDEQFLFGQQVKDSVQRIRDTSLIKEVFNKQKPWSGGRRFNKNYGKRFTKFGGDRGANKKQKTSFRPYEQRFKRGRKKPYDSIDRKGDKKKKDE